MNFLQAAPPLARDAANAVDCLQALVILAIFLVPFYLMMRSLAKFTRIRYGFEGAQEDEGPPIRVCFNCNNTVLEIDFAHCPYCGSVLEEIGAQAEDGSLSNAVAEESGQVLGGERAAGDQTPDETASDDQIAKDTSEA